LKKFFGGNWEAKFMAGCPPFSKVKGGELRPAEKNRDDLTR